MPSDIKRFIIFGGERFYAHGGFHDFISSHDLFVDAVIKGEAALEYSKDTGESYNWFHVWDCTERTVVACSKWQACDAPNETPAMEEQPHAQ